MSQTPTYLALCSQPPKSLFVPFAHLNRTESDWMSDTPANGGRHQSGKGVREELEPFLTSQGACFP